MSSAGLGAGSARDHLVVAKERAVEKDDVGALDPPSRLVPWSKKLRSSVNHHQH
jgi:hypothetical protein